MSMTRKEACEFLLELADETWTTHTVREKLREAATLIVRPEEDVLVGAWDDPELSPGNPDFCAGNGQNPLYECCCDECDYYGACFPERLTPKN